VPLLVARLCARLRFNGFNSGVGELDDWLQHTAAVAAAAGTAATWVLCRRNELSATTPWRWVASNTAPRPRACGADNPTPSRSCCWPGSPWIGSPTSNAPSRAENDSLAGLTRR
jgi:hypothetical protein